MGSACTTSMDTMAVDDVTNRSPWDAWCKQMEKDDDSSMGVFTFTPEEYIDFYIKIEEEMRRENKAPCKNGDTGNSLVLKNSNARL